MRSCEEGAGGVGGVAGTHPQIGTGGVHERKEILTAKLTDKAEW